MKKNIIINAICLLYVLVLHGNSGSDVFKEAVENRSWSWKFDEVIKRVEPLLVERPDSLGAKGQYIDIFRLYDSGRRFLGIRILPEGKNVPIYSHPNMDLKGAAEQGEGLLVVTSKKRGPRIHNLLA